MKETILLVGHGSREPEGNSAIEEFTRRWRMRQPDWDIQVCFIEFALPLVDEGLMRAAKQGARVIVVPLILNAAGHVKMEIPEYIEAARMRQPEVEFICAQHLGACDLILAILKRRLHQAMNALGNPEPATTGLVLLGRGSSDRMANGEVAKMARWLQESAECELVDIAFTGITHPRLEQIVQRHAHLGVRHLAVLPYYLFTGTLMKHIEWQMACLQQQYPHIRFACGESFGFEDEIFTLLEQRVSEAGRAAGRMPCDGCKYREMAHDHHHHHHADAHAAYTP